VPKSARGWRIRACVSANRQQPQLTFRLTGVRLRATLKPLRIRGFVHKGLKRLYLEDNAKSLPADAVEKLRAMLAFLQDMQDSEDLRAFPRWKAHLARHAQPAPYFPAKDGEILDVDHEDYR